jgi:hypothetical protein
MKERDELKQRFEGIDPDEVRKLAEEQRKVDEPGIESILSVGVSSGQRA